MLNKKNVREFIFISSRQHKPLILQAHIKIVSVLKISFKFLFYIEVIFLQFLNVTSNKQGNQGILYTQYIRQGNRQQVPCLKQRQHTYKEGMERWQWLSRKHHMWFSAGGSTKLVGLGCPYHTCPKMVIGYIQ